MTPRSLKCTTITEIVHVVWHRDQHGDMDISIVTLRKPGTIDCGSSSSSMGDESNTHHRFNGPLNREDSPIFGNIVDTRYPTKYILFLSGEEHPSEFQTISCWVMQCGYKLLVPKEGESKSARIKADLMDENTKNLEQRAPG